MENPFPGMDPWMEAEWTDARYTLLVYGSDQIRASSPPGLVARIEERNRHGSEPTDDAPVIDRFLAVRERRPSGRMVTAVEVFDPYIKEAGEARDAYFARRAGYVEAGVNFVEIDLLRGGRWTVYPPPDLLTDALRNSPYRVTVWRAERPSRTALYLPPLRERLPIVPIPLRAGDADALFNLQSLVDRAYTAGAYDDTDYAQPPVPSLSPADADWAAALLRDKGLL